MGLKKRGDSYHLELECTTKISNENNIDQDKKFHASKNLSFQSNLQAKISWFQLSEEKKC